MKKIVLPLLLAAAVLFQGCGKMIMALHGSLPESFVVKKVDNMQGAKGLAVMSVQSDPSTKSFKSGVITKAEGDPTQDYLFIVDGEGKTVLASFIFDEKGNATNKIWRKIRETLTLVPANVFSISEKYLLLSNVYPVFDYPDWVNDTAPGGEESQAINELLWSVSGNFILRVQDGALFRAPEEIAKSQELEYYGGDISHIIQTSVDGKTLVYGGYSKFYEDVLEFSPIVITDNGNELIAKLLPDGSSAGRSPAFCLTPQNRIVPLIFDTKGCWSYDLDLNPLFLDYGEVLARIEWNNAKFFSFNHHLFGLLPGYDEGFIVQFVEVVLDGYTLNVNILDEESFLDNEWSNITMFNKGNPDYYPRSIPNGKIYPYNGGMIIADAKNHTLTVDSFPDGFPSRLSEYDKDGYSWELTDNYSVVKRYSITDKTVKSIDVKWTDYTPADFVLMNYSVVSGIIYLTATTRDAQQHSFIIDGETGKVSDAGVTEYAGAQIRVYVRLN